MRRSVVLSLVGLIAGTAMSACRDGRGTSAQQDSALARDLTLANAVRAEPALRDVPERGASTPAPPHAAAPVRRRSTTPPRPRPAPARAPAPPAPSAAPAPAPATEAPREAAPAAPARATSVIAAGSSAGLTSSERVCSDGGRPGDKMVAHTSEPLVGTNGLVFPAGSAVVVEIASIVESASADSSHITFRLKSITASGVTYPVTGDVIPEGTLEKNRVESKSADKKRVVGGAIAGAILGGVLGGGAKGAVIGAAAGGATGAVVSAARVRYQSCLPAGAAMRLTLTQAVEVTL